MPMHIYKNPEAYSKNNSLQYHFAMSVISHAKIDKNARILDLGCGDGVITHELAMIADEGCVIGTDISREMIEYAGKKYQDQKNLRFIQMDTSNNLFQEQFDMVTSFNSLHWVKDQESALGGIARAVVEGGKVILLFSHKKSHYHYALDTVCSKDKWSQSFKDYSNPRSFFEIKEYDAFLKNAGLVVMSLVEKEMIHNFSSIEKLKDFLNSSMANIKRIPQNQKDEFLDDFCKEFFSLLKCKDFSNIPVGFWCIEVLASKPIQKKEYISSGDLSGSSFRSKL